MLNNCSINANMNNMKGLTLVELLVTLAVFAVLVAIGLPQFQGISTSNRLASYVNSLSGDINFARSEAITRNSNISIRAFNNGTDTKWENGWTVTDDLAAGGPVVIRTAGPVATGFTITEPGGALIITYNGQGIRPRQNNAQVNFTVCESKSMSRLLDVNPIGRVSYTTGASCP